MNSTIFTISMVLVLVAIFTYSHRHIRRGATQFDECSWKPSMPCMPWVFMEAFHSKLVPSWCQDGTKFISSWNQLGTTLAPNWYQVGTNVLVPSCAPTWYQLGNLIPRLYQLGTKYGSKLMQLWNMCGTGIRTTLDTYVKHTKMQVTHTKRMPNRFKQLDACRLWYELITNT